MDRSAEGRLSLRIGRWVGQLTLCCAVLHAAGWGADKKKLSDAVAAVEANMKTDAGKKYDEQFGTELMRKYQSNLRQCKQGVSRLDPYDMFLKLSSEGTVEEVLVYPETQMSTCSGAALQSARFSPPPHNEYWVNIHMTYKR